jgi:G3E family GTPase
MVEAEHGRVAIDALMGLPASLSRKLAATGQELHEVHDHRHEEHKHEDEAAQPDHPFESGSWTCPGVLSADKLIQALKQLPRSVIRVKGWVVTDRHGPVIVHFAGRRVRFEPLGDNPPVTENQLVYIGLREEAMHEALNATLSRLVDPARLPV